MIFYVVIVLISFFLVWMIVAEIKKRKQSEAALKKYACLVDNAHVLQRNNKDEIVSWNKGMEKLYGWTRNEAIGQVTHVLFQTKFPVPIEEIQKQMLEKGEWQGELRHITKQGKQLYVSSHWCLHRDKWGIPDAILETNNDITELKMAEDKFQKREESVHLLIDNVKDYAIYLLDINGNVSSWNNGAQHIKGYRESEIVGRSLDVFYLPEDREKGMPAHNLEMARKLGHYESEGWRVRKDGSPFYANVVFTALRDSTGALYGYSKITRDITERKKAQKQQEFLSLQMNQAHDAICTLDAQMKVLSWNKGAEKLYGFTEAEAMGKEANELLRTEITREQIEAALKMIADKDYWTGDVKRKTKSGETIYVHASSSAIRNEAGTITGFVTVSFDITDQKILQDKVFHLANIVEQSTEGIFSMTTDRTIISWNKGAENLFGFSRTEALGKNGSELGIVRLNAEEIGHVISTVTELGNWSSEMNYYRKNGGSFYGAVSANLVKNEDGDQSSIVFFIKDISVRKQLEENLKKLNEELESFTYSVSHDLRAPLRGIIGFTSILEEDYGSKLDSEAKRITAVIKNNVNRMGLLIDDLLAFSRIGKAEITKTAVVTSRLVNEVIESFGDARVNPKIEWIIHPLPDVMADRNTFRQVWVNLISNAVKYSRERQSPRIEIGYTKEELNYVFYVKDNGVGFDEK